MPSPLFVTLAPASPADHTLLANLLQLYIHDLSDIFAGIEIGDDGRFRYDWLVKYIEEPDQRFAFIVRCDGRIAGFVFAKRGSPASNDPRVLDVAEFFVLRQYRRLGVGRAAARHLWEQMPGAWTVRVAGRNARALAFWSEVVKTSFGEDATEFSRVIDGKPWHVFSFTSRGKSNCAT